MLSRRKNSGTPLSWMPFHVVYIFSLSAFPLLCFQFSLPSFCTLSFLAHHFRPLSLLSFCLYLLSLEYTLSLPSPCPLPVTSFFWLLHVIFLPSHFSLSVLSMSSPCSSPALFPPSLLPLLCPLLTLYPLAVLCRLSSSSPLPVLLVSSVTSCCPRSVTSLHFDFI